MTDWDQERENAERRHRLHQQIENDEKTDDQLYNAIMELPDGLSPHAIGAFILTILAAYGIEGDSAERFLEVVASGAKEMKAMADTERAISKLGD